MRIVSGSLKGRKITAPKNLPVRPTTDMAKEALFNILNNSYYFEDISVLDLFAGTGNICYEFASRGCTSITAVDQFYGCIKFIESVTKQLVLPISPLKSDVFKYLENNKVKFDVIFADPPYDFEKELFIKIPKLIFENDLLNDSGVLVVEHSKHTDLSDLLNFRYSKHYGGNTFSFFEKK
ncbi:MAG: RsmD family RNA methyltransferase [Flavobacteriaceae bacterium]